MKKRTDFDAAIKHWYGDSFTLPEPCKPNPKYTDDTYDLPFDEVAPTAPEADIVDEQGSPLHPTSMTDALMNAEGVVNSRLGYMAVQSDSTKCQF